MNKPRTVQVTHTVTVTEGYDQVAKTELSESVVLSAGEPVFDPALSLIEQLGREASNKTTAQVTAYEHLAKARSAGDKPADEHVDIPF